jgi:hypothetical protein
MIAALLLALSGVAATGNPPLTQANLPVSRRCTANRELLIGGWTMDGSQEPPSDIFPDGSVREFDFVVADGRQLFREYLHYRPGMNGRWSLQNCRLTITDRDLRLDYDVLHLSRRQMTLRQVGETNIERFTRIAD